MYAAAGDADLPSAAAEGPSGLLPVMDQCGSQLQVHSAPRSYVLLSPTRSPVANGPWRGWAQVHHSAALDSLEGTLQLVTVTTSARLSCMESQLHVYSEAWDKDWATVPVVSRIIHMLQFGADVKPTPDVRRVVRLEDLFASIVQVAAGTQKAGTAVAKQESKAAIPKIILVIL